MVLDLFNDPFFKTFFYETSRATKPPCEVKPIYERYDPQNLRTHGPLMGWNIIYALAGFKEEDLKVWSKKREFFVEGSNDNEDSFAFGTKFACNFKEKFTVSDKLDLDKMTVDFEDGLLIIYVPVKEETESDKVFHFGGSKKELTE